MSDIPEDIMNAARKVVIEDLGMDSPGLLQTSYIDCIAEAILAERERSRQLLSEAETREREARVKALEEAAAYHDDLAAQHAASSKEERHHVARDNHAAFCIQHQRHAAAIRALQSEER